VTQQIYSHPLGNGLTLVAEEMDWLESAAFALLLPAGCIYEATPRAGLGNMTCEMIQRGAGERDSRQFVDDLENLGADCSASVSIAHTSFSGAMPAESLETVLGIYADVVRRPHLPEDQLEDARLGCLQEVRAVEDDLAQKMMLGLRSQFYPAPFGRGAQGTMESVNAIQMADVQRFFQQQYQPSGGILSVAGKIDWPRLKDHAIELFGDWKPNPPAAIKETPPPRKYLHIPTESSQTHIGIAYDGLSYADPDYFQLRGAIGALSDGMSSRLFTEVREKRGLCYTVYAVCHSLLERGGVFGYAGTTAERAQETLDVMLAEFARLREGVLPAELDRLKGRIKRAIVLQQESSPSRAGAIAFDWYYLNRVRTMQELSDIIGGLTCESINKYLAEHPPGNFTITTLGPQELEIQSAVS
jgi:predicted Zn-dependent peptidase